jgi:hypothetical protein
LIEFYSDGATVKSNEAEKRIVKYNIIYNVRSMNQSDKRKEKKKIRNYKMINKYLINIKIIKKKLTIQVSFLL